MLISRSYETDEDLRRLCEFMLRFEAPTFRSGDLQYSLSDPSVDRKNSVRIWEDDGDTIGFAFFHGLSEEFVFQTKLHNNRFEAEHQMLEWAFEQFKRVATDSYGLYQSFTTGVVEFDAEKTALLKQNDFTREKDYRIMLDYSLEREIPAPKLPEGFTVRHLKNADEVPVYMETYHRTFLFDYLNTEWRKNVLEMPFYIPELDLIAVAPDGEFAAICFCWLEQSEIEFNAVRKGYIHSVGTRPEFQNMGIGQGLFTTALHRLKAFGAQIAIGHTDADNALARRMYASAGVRPLYKIYRYSWEPNAQAEKKT